MPLTDAGAQEDIRLFNLTDVRGSFSARYWFDERSDVTSSSDFSSELARWQEQLYIRTRSYIYHPAFLELRVSGGPVATQTRSGGGSSETLFGYNVLINALSRKRYPFSVFFTQGYPQQATGASGRFTVKSNDYGIRGNFIPRKSPLRVGWGATRSESFGEGFDTLVDDNQDSANVNASLPYGVGHDLDLRLSWGRSVSRSGSPGLPIFEASTESRSGSLTGRNNFGGDDQIRINQYITRLQRKIEGNSKSDVENLIYNGNLSWEHSDRHTSFASLRFSDTERDTQKISNQGISGSTKYQLFTNLSLSGSARFAKNDSGGFSSTTTGGSFSANYGRQLAIGRLNLGGTMTISRTDQESTRDTITVFDEPIALSGVDAVPLRESFVVVESVIVTNADRTQQFEENIDYRLVTIGETTTIERLVGGNIFDGQVVLVSYEFLTGGTVKYGATTQSVSANLNVPRIANFYVAIRNAESETLSGTPTNPLNNSQRLDFRASRGFSFSQGWSMSGTVELTKQQEDISPFLRWGYRIGVNLPVFLWTGIRLGLERQLVEYEASTEDVDQFRYTVNANTRLPGGVSLVYIGSFGENDGGRVYREDARHTLQLYWRYRLVTFGMNAVQSDIIQGDRRRKDLRVTATIVRYF
jgi:hypothetical protein